MEQINEKSVVPESLNPAVAEKAKEAVLLATTVLGMSRTDVVDTYNHLARQHGVAIGTELDSSKVWLKMYRGVVSALKFDTGLESTESGNTKAPTERTRLSDPIDVGIIMTHADPAAVEKLVPALSAAKKIEKNANRGSSGNANDHWESAYSEIIASIALKGLTAEAAVNSAKREHADLVEVGKFIPESFMSVGGERADFISNVTDSVTSDQSTVVSRASGGRQNVDDFDENEHELTGTLEFPESEFGQDPVSNEGAYRHALDTAADVSFDEEQGWSPLSMADMSQMGEANPDQKRMELNKSMPGYIAGKGGDRDYAGFMYLVNNADDYSDRKLLMARRGEGVEAYNVRDSGIFSTERERNRPEFYEGLKAALGYDDHKDTAGARKFLQRFEVKMQKWVGELENMLDKGITPPLTEKAQERMNMHSQGSLSRQIHM